MTGPSASTELNDFSCIADVYDELVDWAPYGLWIDRLEEQLREHGLRRGHWILDAACGTGLSSLPWLKRGYRVVGVDHSEAMLRRARQRARRDGHRLPVVRQDLLELSLRREFDAALCIHSGLDYLLEEDELARALRSLRGCLRAGGLLAFDKCLDVPAFYQENYTDHRRLSCGTADFHYRWDRERRIMEQRCTVRRTDGGRPERTTVVYHLKATPPERLQRMLEEAGFETEEPVRPFKVTDPGFGVYRAV
ncbi:MAG: class I SAM-dependent DNA methyltransferase [Planctomycetota bacterium]